MSLKTISGFQSFPLSTGSSDVPAFTAGSPLKFQLSTLPRNLGSLAYYLYGVVITFAGTLTQSGGTGAIVNDQRMLAFLIDYLSIQNAWHGSPLSANYVKGYWLSTILPVGGGYNESFPTMPSIPAANGANQFSKSIFLPLCLGNGSKPHHTAQLNVLYRNAYLEIGCQAASVLSAFSPGATFSGITVRASAVCLPEPEIRVGPGIEWVDYQQSASSGQTQVVLDAFGNNTQLINTEAGAGVAYMAAMTSLNGQPGSFDAGNLTQVSVPFRNQIQTQHIPPFLAAQIMSQGARRKMGQAVATSASGQIDNADFPYLANDTTVAAGLNQEMQRLLGLTLVPQPTEVQLSKLQVVNGDTSYYLTLSSGPSGTHHTLVQHVRSWTPKAYDEALKVVKDSKLVNDVFGGVSDQLAWSVKMSNGKNPNDVQPHKLRFLPLALKPASFAKRRQGRA
jgi:hypothetical protein